MVKGERVQYREEEPTELPNPVEGVTLQIFSDLLVDRSNFIKEEMGFLEKENPALKDWLVNQCIILSYRDLALEWALTYYAIYSRSGRKTGQRMPTVSSDLIQASNSQDQVELGPIMPHIEEKDFPNVEKVMKKFLEKQEGKREKVRGLDMNKSDELSRFWVATSLFAFNKIVAGEDPEFIENFILNPTYELSILLSEQVEANRLKKRFSKE